MQVIDDIHRQWMAFKSGAEDESGWAGDAGYGEMAVILPRFKSFIAIRKCGILFGFDNDVDRDCILSDYIGDAYSSMLNKDVAPESVGSARIPAKK